MKKVVQIKAVEENGDNIKNGKEKVSDGCRLNWKSEGRVRLPTFHQFFFFFLNTKLLLVFKQWKLDYNKDDRDNVQETTHYNQPKSTQAK